MPAPEIMPTKADAVSVSQGGPAADAATRARILELIPQQAPFRFVDTIDELSPEHAAGSYRFRQDEFFYAGHFPGQPITPGVILVECMAQIALVPMALYLSEAKAAGVGESEASAGRTLPLFAEADQIEFSAAVRPGDRVMVRGERIYFRRGKLKCRVEMRGENDGATIASAVLAGVAVSSESVG